MNTDLALQKELKRLFTIQRLAVLATHKNGQPYSSLVAFAATKDLKHLIFATSRATRKYEHFSRDNRVALLIDSRTNKAADFHKAVAVTAVGTAVETDERIRPQLVTLYLAKHPHLKDFVQSPTCALVQVSVKTYYIVRTFQNVTKLDVAS